MTPERLAEIEHDWGTDLGLNKEVGELIAACKKLMRERDALVVENIGYTDCQEENARLREALTMYANGYFGPNVASKALEVK